MNTINTFGGIPAEQHQRADALLAMHAANRAMARWTRGITFSEMQLAQALQPGIQAQWYAQSEANFRSWLGAGGFAQADAANAQARRERDLATLVFAR